MTRKTLGDMSTRNQSVGSPRTYWERRVQIQNVQWERQQAAKKKKDRLELMLEMKRLKEL